jgi:rhodanese-related sulfurtransferase
MLKRKSLLLSSLLFILAITAPHVKAGNPDYRSPEEVPGATTITAEEAKKLYDEGVVIIDVRNTRLYARRHIPGAHHLDLNTAYNEDALAALASKDEAIVIYCSGVKCSRSYRASEQAVSWGYRNVRYFRGGIVDWRNAGYPVESRAVEPASDNSSQ